MSVPRPGETYWDGNGKTFTVTGIEFKDDGFHTHYVDEAYNSYSCHKDAFLNRFTLLDNYDCRARNNKMVKLYP